MLSSLCLEDRHLGGKRRRLYMSQTIFTRLCDHLFKWYHAKRLERNATRYEHASRRKALPERLHWQWQ